MKPEILSARARSLLLSWLCLAAAAPRAVAAGAADANSTAPPNPALAVLSLPDAVRLAMEHNPELRASSRRVDAAAGRARQTRVWSNPELEFSAEDWPVGAGGGFSEAKQTVGVAQTLPFPGKKKLDRQIGVSGLGRTEAEFRLRRRELERDVKAAFYQALAAERFVAVAGELVTVAESSATAARKRVAAGAAPDQEQLRAEIPLEEARTGLAEYQREEATARQDLALLLGRPELSGARLAGTLAETANLGLLEQAPAQWLPAYPGVVAAQRARDQAELELRRARLEPYPDVKVGVGGGRIGETDESIIQVGFSLPLPIFDTGKGKREEAQANVRIAEAEQLALEQRLLRAWNTACQRFRTAADQVARYRNRILPRADEALRLVQTGFDQGKFGFIDLLDTQRTTGEARLAYQQKLLELNLAQAQLEAFVAPGTDQPKTSAPNPSANR
jgi:outer membrane protein, heavy metal efflux system